MKKILVVTSAVAGLMAPASGFAEKGVTDSQILLGGTSVLSGPNAAAACQSVADGQTAIFEKVNKAGGIHGRKITYTVLDDAFELQRSVANARRLVQRDEVFALFGGCGTTNAVAIADFAEREKVPFLFPWAASEALYLPPRKNVFTVMPPYSAQLDIMVPYAIERAKPTKAAVLSFNVDGHQRFRDVAKKHLAAAGVQVVYDEVMESTVTDMVPYVLPIKDKNPELLILNVAVPVAGRFFIEMERQGWKPRLVTGVVTLGDEGFVRAVGNRADGIVAAPSITVPTNAEQAKECNDALLPYKPSATPGPFPLFGCMTAKVMVAALEKAGKDLTRAKLVETLETMGKIDPVVSGPVAFDPERRLGLNALYVLGIEKGQLVLTGPPVEGK